MIAAFTCMAASGGLLVARWRLLLRACGGRAGWSWAAVAWARSQVLTLLPWGQLGGDGYRVHQSTRVGLTAAAAAGTALVERLLGLTGLALVALLGTAACGMRPSHVPGRVSVAVVCTVAGVAAAIVWGATHCPAASRMRGFLEQAILPARSILGRPVLGLWAAGASGAVHLLGALAYSAIDRSLGLSTPVWCYLVAVPLINVILFLPIHVAGIGLFEGGLLVLLQAWAGRTTAEVMAICTVVRALGLLWLGLLSMSFLLATPIPAERDTQESRPDLDTELAGHEPPRPHPMARRPGPSERMPTSAVCLSSGAFRGERLP